jgi:hypothetical protein
VSVALQTPAQAVTAPNVWAAAAGARGPPLLTSSQSEENMRMGLCLERSSVYHEGVCLSRTRGTKVKVRP